MVPIRSNPLFDELVQQQARPPKDPVMRQSWERLFFAHARCDADRLAASLPAGLELQTFDGDAWLGFVPFAMRSLRFSSLPWPDFFETNLRTYVNHPVHGPGVWFYSLDASGYLPCLAARNSFNLPYCCAGLDLVERGSKLNYYGTRADRQRLPTVFEHPSRDFRYTAELRVEGAPLPAEPDSFDFWLLERYRLYSADRKGRLLTARVWHEPYQVVEPKVLSLNVESGDPRFNSLSFEHFRYCSGVKVECFKPEWV